MTAVILDRVTGLDPGVADYHSQGAGEVPELPGVRYWKRLC